MRRNGRFQISTGRIDEMMENILRFVYGRGPTTKYLLTNQGEVPLPLGAIPQAVRDYLSNEHLLLTDGTHITYITQVCPNSGDTITFERTVEQVIVCTWFIADTTKPSQRLMDTLILLEEVPEDVPTAVERATWVEHLSTWLRYQSIPSYQRLAARTEFGDTLWWNIDVARQSPLNDTVNDWEPPFEGAEKLYEEGLTVTPDIPENVPGRSSKN